MWRSRDLTLFGRVLIIKTLGISNFVYSASNIDVTKEIINNVQSRLFKFLWKNKGDKIKRVGVYQDYEKGGLRMSDLETMIKALRLAWIPRLSNNSHPNWKTVPNYHLKKWGGLDFLLLCNYRMKDFEFLPRFYHDILLFFDELKTLYGHKGISDLLHFNNRDILIVEKPFFFQEWFVAGIKTIMHLLDTDGQFLSFPDLKIQILFTKDLLFTLLSSGKRNPKFFT